MIGKRIGQGRTADVYEWSDGKVIKLFHPDISNQVMEEEYQKHTLIQNLVECLPRACGKEVVSSQRGIIYERIDGFSSLHQIMRKPEQTRDIAKQLGVQHAKIHNVTTNDLPDLKQQLKNVLSISKLARNQIDLLFEKLDKLPDGNALCHLDYHPDNVYIDHNSCMVLDWMTAVKGSRWADVARTILMLRYAVIPDFLEGQDTVLMQSREELVAHYLEGYSSIHELNLIEMEEWLTIMLAARLSEQVPYKEIMIINELLENRLSKVK